MTPECDDDRVDLFERRVAAERGVEDARRRCPATISADSGSDDELAARGEVAARSGAIRSMRVVLLRR